MRARHQRTPATLETIREAPVKELSQLGMGPNPGLPFGFSLDETIVGSVNEIKRQVYVDNPDWFLRTPIGLTVYPDCMDEVLSATMQAIADDIASAPAGRFSNGKKASVDATIEVRTSPIWVN